MVKDTNFILIQMWKNTFKDVRDSLYVENIVSDYIAPEIDFRITVSQNQLILYLPMEKPESISLY
jgi:hypothetical protein